MSGAKKPTESGVDYLRQLLAESGPLFGTESERQCFLQGMRLGHSMGLAEARRKPEASA